MGWEIKSVRTNPTEQLSYGLINEFTGFAFTLPLQGFVPTLKVLQRYLGSHGVHRPSCDVKRAMCETRGRRVAKIRFNLLSRVTAILQKRPWSRRLNKVRRTTQTRRLA